MGIILYCICNAWVFSVHTYTVMLLIIIAVRNLLSYELLKISIIRTKMWSLKMRHYDSKCCEEQLANSICIFLQALDCYHKPCILLSKPSHNLKYHFQEQQNTFQQFLCLARHKTAMLLYYAPAPAGIEERRARTQFCIGVISYLYVIISISLCFINLQK